MKILLIENGYNDLKKSRIPLGSYFQSLGNEVYFSCPDPKETGIFSISMSRNTLAPLQIINGGKRLIQLEQNNTFQAVLSFRLVPNVINYLASFRNRDVKRAAVVTGLGYAFVATNNSGKAIVQRTLIKIFYRMASRRLKIITQNPDDLADLGVNNGSVILGSGIVKTGDEAKIVFDTESIKFLYVGRLLKCKGIGTVVSIFEQMKLRNIKVSLTIAGTVDPDNPDSITEAELLDLRNRSGVNYLGFVSDLHSVYAKCNVLLFPSMYREGVPRVILEALKYGLTVVTRDMPGCKETIRKNGFLISENAGVDEVIQYLISLDSRKLLENRLHSKSLFDSKFSAEIIYPQYLSHIS